MIWAHGAPRSLTLIWRTLFRKETVIDIFFSLFICYQRGPLCLQGVLQKTMRVSLKGFYNFKRFLACMIFLTTRSVLVFLPGNLSMAWIILVSAFHLSCKFWARL